MRERMLFLSAQSNSPEDVEGERRTESFLHILLERFDIDLLEYCHCRRETPALPVPALKVHQVKRSSDSRASLFFPLNRLRTDSPRMHADKSLRAEITGMCRLHPYTHVFIAYSMLGSCLDLVSSLLPKAVIITDARRFSSRLLESKAAGKHGISRSYHKLNAAIIRREERRLMSKASLLLTASEWDALSYKALSFADAGKVHVVPPNIDLSRPYYSASDSASDSASEAVAARDRSIVLHWNMHTSQGKHAALLFLKKICPLVKAEVPDFCCRIISDQVHPEVAAWAQKDSAIEIIPEVSRTAHYIRRAGAVAATLREGCGGPVKILESWALRTPVVSSLNGSEALRCEPGRNILLAETSAAFAGHLVKLLTAPELGSILAEQAYRTLAQYYAADGVKQKVLSLV